MGAPYIEYFLETQLPIFYYTWEGYLLIPEHIYQHSILNEDLRLLPEEETLRGSLKGPGRAKLARPTRGFLDKYKYLCRIIIPKSGNR